MALASLVQLQKHEFQQVFRWDVDFSSLKDLNLPKDLDTLSHLCETTAFPTKTIGTGDASFKGIKVYQGGIPDFGNTTEFTFVENVKSDILDNLLFWSDLVANTNETVVGSVDTGEAAWLGSIGNDRSGASYKVNLDVFRLDSRKNRVYGIRFDGAFPTVVAPGGGGDGTTNDFVKPTFTLTFDAWYRIAV